MREDNQKKLDKSAWIKYWAVAVAKMQRIVGILVVPELSLGLLGWWLDKKFATGPIFLLAFILLGFIISIIALLKMIKNKE